MCGNSISHLEKSCNNKGLKFSVRYNLASREVHVISLLNEKFERKKNPFRHLYPSLIAVREISTFLKFCI